MYCCIWEPLGVSGRSWTRITGWLNSSVYWTNEVAFRWTWEHWHKIKVHIGGLLILRGVFRSADDKPGSTWKCWLTALWCQQHVWKYRWQAWVCRQEAWEHPGAPATSLKALWITVEQSGKHNIFFGNATGVPGNHSYYLLFNNL